MKSEGSSLCTVCKGAGVLRQALEYPSFEDQRCCPHCKVGWSLAEAIARIVARTRGQGRAQVA